MMSLKSSLSTPLRCGIAMPAPAAPRSARAAALARRARAAMLSARAAAIAPLSSSSSPTSKAHRSSISSNRPVVSCSATTTRTPSPQTDAAETLSRGIVYTTHEGNSWEATLAPSGTTILVDPWLVGALTFGDTPWLYEGRKKRLPQQDLAAVCSRTDAILISQALPDHAHGPTLRALPDKSIPVVCSPAAEAAVRGAGFTNVTPLAIGKSAETAGGKIRVTATAGALVGPPWATRENGFVIEELGTATTKRPLRIYYEPHCDWGEGALDGLAGSSSSSSSSTGAAGSSSSETTATTAIDVVVTPAVSQKLAGYPLVMGEENLVRLVKTLKPAALVPLVNAEFEQSGPLAAAIQQVGDGGRAAVEARLRGAGMGSTKYCVPEAPGRPLAIEIE